MNIILTDMALLSIFIVPVVPVQLTITTKEANETI